MTMNVSRRSLLRLAPVWALRPFSAAARWRKRQNSAHRRPTGTASSLATRSEVVSDGTLPLGPPKGTFVGVPDEEVRKMLSDNFLNPDNVVSSRTGR